jgi:hypothetical protein
MPIRKIPKNYMTVTGAASSSKSKELIGYEGRLEFYFVKTVSFNNNVRRCEEQPVQITFHDSNGKKRSYTLDFRITYREDLYPKDSWKPLLVEVKPRARLFKKLAEFRPKFRAARQLARSTGQNFAIITDQEIICPYLKNVLFLLKFRSYPVDQTATNLLLGAIKERRTTTPQALMLEVTDCQTRRGELLPTLWQLIANFAVQTNLEEPLTMNSRISWPIQGGNEENNETQSTQGCCDRTRWQALRSVPLLG